MLSRKNNGITLVVLVITIVILLILAGISISALTNTGLFGKAKEAKSASENAEKEQSQTLSEYEKELNKYIAEELTDDKINTVLSKTDNTVLKDANGNIFTLPAGFKVVVNDDTNNAKTVDKGIVVEDVTDAETKGSQFVWIPTGNVYTDIEQTETNTKEINLNRYFFNKETGLETVYNNENGKFIEEDAGDSSFHLLNKGNAIAKNMTEFKSSVAKYSGYYIGRYEARKTSNNSVIESKEYPIYNNIKQVTASKISKSMYSTDTKFISDLMNSYAWDTAILFIQKCTSQKNYSHQKSLNNSIERYGTDVDIQCNIYDMASNIYEWTTETSPHEPYYCVTVGGLINGINFCYGRDNFTINAWDTNMGFRPIIYIKES